MARAETIETVGENDAGGSVPLPCHNTCRMEVPRPLHTWPSMLSTRTTRSGTGINSTQLSINHHHLEPFQPLNLLYSLPYPHPEGQDEPELLPPSATPPHSPPSNQGSQGTVAPSDSSQLQSDSDREEEDYQHVSSRQGPLPDLLPQNEHPSWAFLHPGDHGAGAVQELDIRRVANHLRIIGDEFNATVLRRAHGAPHWQDLREVCMGIFNFITHTLSTLYRLT